MSDLERIVDVILTEPTGDTVVDAVRSLGHGIGYTCSYVPEPLLSVRGLVPVRVRVPNVSGTPMADTYLSSVLCPYARTLLEAVLDDMLPQIDGWVLTSTLRAFVADRGRTSAGRLHDREPKPRARLLLVGSQLDDPRFVELIESCGAQIVADRFCNGAFPGLEPIEYHERPLHALAYHTLSNTACPRMMDDFPRRLNDILRIVRDFRVDGVIVETMKFCDLWGVECAALVRAIRDARIPVLRLEREYAHGGEGQVRTRVQAFLESMDR